MNALLLLASIAFLIYGATRRPVYGPELPEHLRPPTRLGNAVEGLLGGAIGLVGLAASLCWAVLLLAVFLAPLAFLLLVLGALL